MVCIRHELFEHREYRGIVDRQWITGITGVTGVAGISRVTRRATIGSREIELLGRLVEIYRCAGELRVGIGVVLEVAVETVQRTSGIVRTAHLYSAIVTQLTIYKVVFESG